MKQAGLQAGQSGVFDAKTQSAVRQYQQAKGLQVDGVVGQQTWARSSRPGCRCSRAPGDDGEVLRRPPQHPPTELFYDPKGAVKNGSDIAPIGDHVHVAF